MTSFLFPYLAPMPHSDAASIQDLLILSDTLRSDMKAIREEKKHDKRSDSRGGAIPIDFKNLLKSKFVKAIAGEEEESTDWEDE